MSPSACGANGMSGPGRTLTSTLRSAAANRLTNEFFETAREVVLGLEMELRRFPAHANRTSLASARNRMRTGPFDAADVAALR